MAGHGRATIAVGAKSWVYIWHALCRVIHTISTPMENLSGAIAPKTRLKGSAKVKTFVLDTNVLLHDPQSIYKFEDNNLAIPVTLLFSP